MDRKSDIKARIRTSTAVFAGIKFPQIERTLSGGDILSDATGIGGTIRRLFNDHVEIRWRSCGFRGDIFLALERASNLLGQISRDEGILKKVKCGAGESNRGSLAPRHH